MSEVVVIGAFKARAGKEEEATELFRAIVQPTHEEDGCVLYALNRGIDDPSRLAFIERWTSREHLDAHLASSHVAAALERVDELCEESGITVYEAVPAGEAEKGSLAAHAGSGG